MHDTIIECVKILKLARPFKIEIVSASNPKMDAAYWPKYSEKKLKLTHMIRVYLGQSARSLETLIAHEFIHAWQEENKLSEYHGPEFIRMARKLEYKLGLSEIYIPGTDIENPPL